MRQPRHYNLDAYRNISDLQDKVKAHFKYNNLLLTCYDASILLLHDLFYSVNPTNVTDLPTYNVESLVLALDKHMFDFAKSIKYYDRLYHIYCLVYEGYLQATAEDVNRGIDCLLSIINVYVREIPMTNLLEIYSFVFPGEVLPSNKIIDDPSCRDYIAQVLSLRNIPVVNY